MTVDARRLVAIIAMTAIVAGIVGASFAWLLYEQIGPAQKNLVSSGGPSAHGNSSPTVAALAKAASQSCVEVVTGTVTRDGVASGSAPVATGVVVGQPDLVLTTTTAVANATNLRIATASGNIYSAVIEATDVEHGIVLLKVVGSTGLTPLALATQSPVAGDVNVAVGLPLSGSMTVVSGTVASVGTDVSLVGGATVVDASVIAATSGPGLTGGPVIDGNGDVVGLVDGTSTEGGIVSVALPAITAIVADAGASGGGGATFGLTAVLLTPATAAALGTQPGALITQVTPGGPAATAGLEVGDVVRSIEGSAVDASNPLDPALFLVGQTTTLVVVRGHQTLSISLTVGGGG